MTTATATYTIDSPEVQEFLTAWHENGRAPFERFTSALDYDTYEPKTAKDRRKFIALDKGTSGCFLLEKETGMIWNIKAYGRPLRQVKHIALLTADYQYATANHRAIRAER